MIGATIIAVVSAWLLGVLPVAALWPRERALRSDLLLIIPLGLGAGLGVTSALFFAASLLSPEPLRVAAILELILAATMGGWLGWRRRTSPTTGPVGGPAPSAFWLTAVLGTLFAQAGIVAAVTTTRAWHAEPYSNSDGWTIWLMHARFIFRGGENWPGLLLAPQIAWTHPDYPLLVPASIARAWAFAGHDAPFVSATISTLFGVATVGLLVGAVSRVRHWCVALVGGLVLLGTPFFVTFSSNQHADIPLGFYILATLVLIAQRDLPAQPRASSGPTIQSPGKPALSNNERRGYGFSVLVGAAAGMAAWTKNEGLLFAMVAGGAWCMHETARGSPHRIGAFVIGLLVALLPVLYFKIMLAPPNDIVASQPWDRWADLLDWSRHRLILLSLARDIVRFGDWSVVPFLAMLLPLIGGSWRQINQPERLVAFVLGLMLAGFYTVYLLTHWELRAHLDSSLVRVLLQLWPAAVFLWCLAVPYNAPDTMSTAAGSTGRRRTATTAVLLANVALGGAVFVAMDRQPAANELGGGTVRGDKVRVLLGEGWFGRESYEGDVWAWSKGESALLLQLDAKESRTITLRFSIRGVDTRTVTATMGERLVWRTVVGEQTDLVEITGLILQPGTTRIVFRSDTPGTPESTAPGARTITYALYNATVGEVGGSDK